MFSSWELILGGLFPGRLKGCRKAVQLARKPRLRFRKLITYGLNPGLHQEPFLIKVTVTSKNYRYIQKYFFSTNF